MSKRFYSKKSEKLASEAHKAYQAGREETDLHAVSLLEEKLRRDHTDVLTRCALLGFYSKPTCKTPEVWCTHAEWLIKNCPGEKLIMHVIRAPDSIDQDQFEALKEYFLQKVKRNPKNAIVAGNAAYFVGLRDLHLTKKLLKRAQRLAPDNFEWSSDLFFLYSSAARFNNDKKLADKAFKVGDKLISRFEKKAHYRLEVFTSIKYLCELALEFEDFKRCAKYIKTLKNADLDVANPHYKHYYKGLLALRKGNIERSKSQLLKFANQGGLFGGFVLANSLLDLGEAQTVAEYLNICIQDQKMDHHEKHIKQWIKQIEKGQKVKLEIPTAL